MEGDHFTGTASGAATAWEGLADRESDGATSDVIFTRTVWNDAMGFVSQTETPVVRPAIYSNGILIIDTTDTH
jgi:hypothetical protein